MTRRLLRQALMAALFVVAVPVSAFAQTGLALSGAVDPVSCTISHRFLAFEISRSKRAGGAPPKICGARSGGGRPIMALLKRLLGDGANSPSIC